MRNLLIIAALLAAGPLAYILGAARSDDPVRLLYYAQEYNIDMKYPYVIDFSERMSWEPESK